MSNQAFMEMVSHIEEIFASLRETPEPAPSLMDGIRRAFLEKFRRFYT